MSELIALGIGMAFVTGLNALSNYKSNSRQESYSNDVETPKIAGTQYPAVKQFYAKEQAQANLKAQQQYSSGNSNVNSFKEVGNLMRFAGPDGTIPQDKTVINLSASGDQSLNYQLYQQAINAATPTLAQLNSISGESYQQTGDNAILKGGLSQNFPAYAYSKTGNPAMDSEYQAVNLGNGRAESISACAQNAPTFISTSLLPKPTVPGQNSWNVEAPQNILASQNFLSAVQQIGTDTVLSSLRNASRDIRGDIPNPISIMSPWNNTTITPDPERGVLVDYVPKNGLYGSPNIGTGGQYVGQ